MSGSLRRAASVGGVLALSAGLAGAFVLPRLGEEPGPGLATAPVVRGDARQILATTGRIRPLLTVDVGSQISGQILSVEVDHNSAVTAGDVIARIDPVTYEARVAQAEAALASARAAVAVQEAAIARARAVLLRAERQSRRAGALRSGAYLAEQAWEAAVAEAEIAAADLRTSLAQHEAARTRLLQAEAELDAARIDLGRTWIRSPVSGTVIERRATAGQTVVAALSSPILFRIAETLDRMAIDAQIDEADVGTVGVSNPVEFTTAADPEIRRAGELHQLRLAPSEGQAVVTYTAVILAENVERRLLPGMTANVFITTGERRGVLLMPSAALSFRPVGAAPVATATGSVVWVADQEQRITPHRVALGLITDGLVEIIEGLTEGELVVTGTRSTR